MTVVAAAQVDTTMWWITLGAALGAAVVVAALLHLLFRAVCRVERNVVALWDTATTLAQNTATTWMLPVTGGILEGLEQEVRRHERLLSEKRPR